MRVLAIMVMLLVASSSIAATDSTLTALAAQYQTLWARQKALPQGEFDKELRGSGGQLEKVLTELGQRLGKSKYTEQDIVRIMGEPDARKTAGEFLPPSIDHRAPRGVIEKDKTILIYFWRGWHDYLFFVSQRGKITGAYWYLAGE
jgi:hypothetical protein